MQQLERTPMLGELVLDLVDSAHSARTEKPHDAELPRDECARIDRRKPGIHTISSHTRGHRDVECALRTQIMQSEVSRSICQMTVSSDKGL
jgi:hypothetical protein